jgi:hypothetical protein
MSNGAKSVLRVLTLFLMILPAACQTINLTDPCWRQVTGIAQRDFARQLNREIYELQSTVEESLVFRAEILELAAGLEEQKSAALTGKQLQTLRQGTVAYLKLRQRLYAFAERYECLVDAEETGDVRLAIDHHLKTKAAMMSLSAALTLYDNYMLAIVVFEADSRLRRLLNDPDAGFDIQSNQLDKVTESANSIAKRQRIRRGIALFERLVKTEHVVEDERMEYLYALITSSPSYQFTLKVQIGEIASRKFSFLERVGSDFLAEMKDEGVNLLSLIFGNTVGLYEERKGLLNDDGGATQHIRESLRPLDILLEKTPFRLTDRFIPGHFGHVAIWIGNEEELRALGVWDHPVVVQYHDRINSRNGHNVIEALRPGVQLNSLEHFMNVDDVAVLRPTTLTIAQKREALVLALRQIGKKYDFNFDVNTTDKIVCSELIYISFPTIQWPTKRTFGRHTISPDLVARLAFENRQLQLMLFYRKGKLLPGHVDLRRFRTLVAGKAGDD